MRTRANYGVIGVIQTLNTSSTGGIYSAVDQQLASQSSNWPLSGRTINYLIVAGGGGGAGFAGGGGAGGLLSSTATLSFGVTLN